MTTHSAKERARDRVTAHGCFAERIARLFNGFGKPIGLDVATQLARHLQKVLEDEEFALEFVRQKLISKPGYRSVTIARFIFSDCKYAHENRSWIVHDRSLYGGVDTQRSLENWFAFGCYKSLLAGANSHRDLYPDLYWRWRQNLQMITPHQQRYFMTIAKATFDRENTCRPSNKSSSTTELFFESIESCVAGALTSRRR